MVVSHAGRSVVAGESRQRIPCLCHPHDVPRLACTRTWDHRFETGCCALGTGSAWRTVEADHRASHPCTETRIGANRSTQRCFGIHSLHKGNEYIMNTSRFEIISPADLADYRDRADEIADLAWPEFMLHDPVANDNWHELFDRFVDYQFALFDIEKNRM